MLVYIIASECNEFRARFSFWRGQRFWIVETHLVAASIPHLKKRNASVFSAPARAKAKSIPHRRAGRT
jgi:hypothetical protein